MLISVYKSVKTKHKHCFHKHLYYLKFIPKTHTFMTNYRYLYGEIGANLGVT